MRRSPAALAALACAAALAAAPAAAWAASPAPGTGGAGPATVRALQADTTAGSGTADSAGAARADTAAADTAAAGVSTVGLSGSKLDNRTAQVAAQLRCPVCRGQSVLESQATLANEMKEEIRRRLAAGEKPDAIKKYFVSRYGEWILLKPPARGINLLVYLLPAGLLLGGLGLAVLFVRSRTTPEEAEPGTGEEETPPGAESGTEAGTAPGAEGWTGAGGQGEREPSGSAPEEDLSRDDEAWLERALDERRHASE